MSGVTRQVLVAFNNGPLDDPAAITTVASPQGTLGGTNVWTDISPYVKGCQSSRGRQHELSQFEAGTVSLDLNNGDGRFHPWNTSSPYAGLLTIRKPVRVNAVVAGVTYPRLTGHVDAWPTVWADTVTFFAQCHATDAFRLLQLADLTSTGYPAQVAADGPAGYWRLGDPAGSLNAADSSGNAKNAILQTGGGIPVFGGAGAIPADPNTSVSVPATGAVVSSIYAQAFGKVSSSGGMTFETWLQVPASAAYRMQLLFSSGPTNALKISPSGSAIIVQDVAGASSISTAATSINDGNWHHLVVTVTSLFATLIYLDGVQVGSGTLSFTPNPGGAFASYLSNTGTAAMNYQDWAIYASVLSAAQVAKHFSLAAVPQQATDARIGRVCDIVGWPAGARSLDSGISTVQAVTSSLTTTSALSQLQACEATEGGALFIDTVGRVRFVNRHSFLTQTHFATSQATFGDQVGDIPFVPAPNLGLDDIDLYNEARGQRSGGAIQIASNPASVGQFGRSTWQPSGQLIGISDAEVLGMCQYVVNNRKTPKSRLQSITVNLRSLTDAQLATVLSLDLLYRVTVDRTAAMPGDSFLEVGLIEHISETVTADQWTITFGLDVADTTAYWLMGTSQIGINTALAY